ncbi:hypothetical protein V5O48_015762, partial [Marasmius crinis-equi]
MLAQLATYMQLAYYEDPGRFALFCYHKNRKAIKARSSGVADRVSGGEETSVDVQLKDNRPVKVNMKIQISVKLVIRDLEHGALCTLKPLRMGLAVSEEPFVPKQRVEEVQTVAAEGDDEECKALVQTVTEFKHNPPIRRTQKTCLSPPLVALRSSWLPSTMKISPLVTLAALSRLRMKERLDVSTSTRVSLMLGTTEETSMTRSKDTNTKTQESFEVASRFKHDMSHENHKALMMDLMERQLLRARSGAGSGGAFRCSPIVHSKATSVTSAAATSHSIIKIIDDILAEVDDHGGW